MHIRALLSLSILYGSKKCLPGQKKECTLKLCDSQTLEVIFTSKKEKLQKERDNHTIRKINMCNFNIIRSSQTTHIIFLIIPRKMRWAGHAARICEKITANKILVGKT